MYSFLILWEFTVLLWAIPEAWKYFTITKVEGSLLAVVFLNQALACGQRAPGFCADVCMCVWLCVYVYIHPQGY